MNTSLVTGFPALLRHRTLIVLLVLAAAGRVTAGPLADYLANPPVIAKPTWPSSMSPATFIPAKMRQLEQGASDGERGNAVGNLAHMARYMSMDPVSRPAAGELLDTVVMPHLNLTRGLDPADVCSWRHALLTIRNAYHSIGNRQAELNCLRLLYMEEYRPGDRELAIYLLAYHQAEAGDVVAASNTFHLLPAQSKWASCREETIKLWRARQAKVRRHGAKAAVSKDSTR